MTPSLSTDYDIAVASLRSPFSLSDHVRPFNFIFKRRVSDPKFMPYLANYSGALMLMGMGGVNLTHQCISLEMRKKGIFLKS